MLISSPDISVKAVLHCLLPNLSGDNNPHGIKVFGDSTALINS
jgi:hypothetical protein